MQCRRKEKSEEEGKKKWKKEGEHLRMIIKRTSAFQFSSGKLHCCQAHSHVVTVAKPPKDICKDTDTKKTRIFFFIRYRLDLYAFKNKDQL